MSEPNSEISYSDRLPQGEFDFTKEVASDRPQEIGPYTRINKVAKPRGRKVGVELGLKFDSPKRRKR